MVQKNRREEVNLLAPDIFIVAPFRICAWVWKKVKGRKECVGQKSKWKDLNLSGEEDKGRRGIRICVGQNLRSLW